jgi:hypothetical protein
LSETGQEVLLRDRGSIQGHVEQPLVCHSLQQSHFDTPFSLDWIAAVMLALKLLVAFALPLVSALKFDIKADHTGESILKERCIRNFAAKDQLVVVTIKTSGSRGDGQMLQVHVRSPTYIKKSKSRVSCTKFTHSRFQTSILTRNLSLDPRHRR